MILDFNDLHAVITSCITSYGTAGIPLNMFEEEFESLCGYSIPYRKYGWKNLKAFLQTLPNIYIIKDQYNNDIVIEQSKKTLHIKNLMLNQKTSYGKRKEHSSNYEYKNKKPKYKNNYNETKQLNNLPEGVSIHSSINNISFNKCERYEEFDKLETMLPVLYKHQALGDDFFVDLADKKLACYISESLACGLCEVGQTISQLTEKIKKTSILAPRVVVMIGMNDLLQGRNINNMILDLSELVKELKKKNTRITLLTLIPSPKLKQSKKIQLRMEIFNKVILEYGQHDPDWQCNIIDMEKIFQKELQSFKRDFDRLEKVAQNDIYKVFSDYGRKIFLNALRVCLREHIRQGH